MSDKDSSCSVCTYQNVSSLFFCEMCNAPLLAVGDCSSLDPHAALLSDANLAESLQLAEFKQEPSSGCVSTEDLEHLALLQTLACNEELDYRAAKAARWEEEAKLMLATPQGQAWSLIAEVVRLHERLKPDFEEIKKGSQYFETVSVDDMVYFAEKLITCQDAFRAAGKPASITVGYHTTKDANMEGIRRGGLMSGPERQANSVQCKAGGGARFGPGIYTGTNPYAFQSFGNVTLITAILKGASKRVLGSQRPSNFDTVIGNKVIGNKVIGNKASSPSSAHYNDEVVLHQSSQCLPLISFSTALLSGRSHQTLQTPASQLIWRFHQELQYLLDDFLNTGEEMTPELVLTNTSGAAVARIPRPASAKMASMTTPDKQITESTGSTSASYLQSVFDLLMPSSLVGQTNPSHRTPAVSSLEDQPATGTFPYSAPLTLNTKLPTSCFRPASDLAKEECSVCLSSLSSSVVQLVRCKHNFHKECLDRALQHKTACPLCRKPILEPQGISPSGTMTVSLISYQHCKGYENCGTIQIKYSLPGDAQKSYHENPGTSFSSTNRTAYLPDNQEARKLLKRLKHAWSHGLIFTVGTSLTSGKKNVIVWASIHHKTRQSGGTHGFPDPSYFMNCNNELDALGVPPSEEC